MHNLILAFITALLIVIFGIPSIITVAKLKGLYDKPNNRKIHTNKIPRLGGMAIIAGFSIAASIWLVPSENMAGMQYLQAALIILFISGLKDDIIIISPIKKLLSQIIAASIIVFGNDIQITDFQGLFGLNEIPMYISVPLTMFTIIVITNAFNLIDGVDGLASGIGFISSTTFGLWFSFTDEIGWAVMALALSGALLGFLIFNFNPARIFMGDAGSLTVGFLLSVFALKFIEFNNASITTLHKINAAPAIAIAILIVPLFDTIRVFTIRVLKKQSPFMADQNHIHHLLIKTGLGHKEVCLGLCLTNIAFVAVAFLLKDSSSSYLFALVAICAVILSYIPTYILKHKLIDIEAERGKTIEEEFASELKLKNNPSSKDDVRMN
jgi:UDP-GlcNAc:undecaprenyl-phosphate GlcNAc-1-phosphate transferase